MAQITLTNGQPPSNLNPFSSPQVTVALTRKQALSAILDTTPSALQPTLDVVEVVLPAQRQQDSHDGTRKILRL